MPRYVAFLRAINVGGRTVKMDRLQLLFEEIGFSRVETFIASGNVLFTSPSRSPKMLEARIADQLREALGYGVPAFLRSPAELAIIARYRPFGDVMLSAKGAAMYVGFGADAPSAEARRKLSAMKSETDAFEVRGREVYWLCRKRMMGSVYSGALLEKTLGMPVTFRNLTTVAKLAARHA